MHLSLDIEESLREITKKENMRLRDLAMGGVSEIAPEVKMSENLFQEFVTRITTLRDRYIYIYIHIYVCLYIYTYI
jgi:hypothetical protein